MSDRFGFLVLKQQRIYRWMVAWIAFSVALTAFDWPIGSLGPFWREHAFLTSIVSGVMMLGIGLFTVDAWLKTREANRWTHMSRIAAKEMGFVTDNLLVGMDYLLTGDGIRIEDVDAQQLPLDELSACLERHGLVHCEAHIDRKARLHILLADPEWVRISIRSLDTLKHAHRRSLAIWVPVIVAVDSMTPLINGSAEINESVFLLQDYLRTLLEPDDARLSTDEVRSIAGNPVTIQAVTIGHWLRTRAGIVDLQENCMRAANLDTWQNPRR